MVTEIQSALSVIRRKQVEARTGLTRSPIYARIKAGTFPRQISLGGGKAVGWIESEIEAWIAAQVEKRRSLDSSK